MHVAFAVFLTAQSESDLIIKEKNIAHRTVISTAAALTVKNPQPSFLVSRPSDGGGVGGLKR